MKPMTALKYCSVFIFLAVLTGGIFRLFKRFHFLKRMGVAEKAGLNIDASIKHAAEHLERATKIVEGMAQEEYAKTLGKNIDEGLAEAKASLKRIASLLQNTTTK
jgi:hypothetical protein